jgi:hypothetical protein
MIMWIVNGERFVNNEWTVNERRTLKICERWTNAEWTVNEHFVIGERMANERFVNGERTLNACWTNGERMEKW